ncbi:amino acid adenylation domain-containing protein [Streptomyces cinnamoneus]|uniref:amino acid adenylation domain-containing protein n=1 Tax=Streptomyces cinnamoneus TaxID=53446 RepID=UPI003438944C
MATAVRYRVAVPVGPGRLPAAQARSCHSLTTRVEGPVTSRPVTGLHLWQEAVPVASEAPEARVRLRAEAARPLAPSAPPVRAVLLTYADGRADLVLVARRSALDERGLRELAAFLLDGTGRPPAIPAAGSPVAGGTRRAPEWGLGEPSRTGRAGSVPIALEEPEPSDALLTAAVGLVLARYTAGEDTSLAVFDPLGTGADVPVRSVPLDDQQTAGAHVAAWQQEGADAAAPGPVPTVGVLIGEQRPGTHYRPFLAPALPAVVHWRRAADGSVDGTLTYDEGEIAPEVARGFATCLAHTVHALAAAGPDTPLAEVDLLPHAEALAVAETGVSAPVVDQRTTDRTIHGLFADVARRQPGAVAVVDGATGLTYAQLDERAERLATGLHGIGARPGDLIGVALDRTADLIVALLGVLKAGCVYVPMDIRYPEERLRYTVGNAGTTVVVGSAESFPRIDGVRVVSPAELIALAEETPDRIPVPEDGGSAAYVIYTSGSTGRPKGVTVPHRNVAALIAATREDFALADTDVWTFFHSSAFDFSVWEIWGCLLTGGRLVVVPYWVTRDTDLFYELLAERKVTVLNQTPSAFAQLVEADSRMRAELSLRLVVFGGEPLDVGMLAPWFARHSHTRCRLSNMFGITETTVHVTEQTVTPADVVVRSRSVGRAMPGWSLSVRDPRGRILPPGAPGEIYVGGAGVARGYLHQPELTAERFIDDPYGHGRVYRSGDRGRLRPDGRLDHLGRLDSQVKVRGHRIELDEIRNVLLSHPAVSGAAVVLRYDTPGDTATARIDAYAVISGPGVPVSDVVGHASGVLPDYMMPATVTPVDAIPLTINGKVDTAALPEPSTRDTTAVAAAAPAEGRDERPADPVTAEILQLWSQALNTDVGLDDNFFELGGNSLLVIRLLREMRDRGLPRVSTQDFYRNSVAAQFVQLVHSAGGN